jgi:excisionase family DNA binding protein
LTIKEAAALARLHYRTLYKIIERGELGPAQGLIRHPHRRRQYLIKEAPFRRVFIEGEAPS